PSRWRRSSPPDGRRHHRGPARTSRGPVLRVRGPGGKGMTTPTPADPSVRAVQFEYSNNLVPILQHLGASLLVSTYQAGKLVAVGRHEGKLTLGFHNFEQAMGVAVHPRQVAVGSRRQVWFLRAAHHLAARIDPVGRHDACYLARSAHFTGPIHGHEM